MSNFKPILFTLSLGTLLGLGFILFSIPEAKRFLENAGIYYPSISWIDTSTETDALAAGTLYKKTKVNSKVKDTPALRLSNDIKLQQRIQYTPVDLSDSAVKRIDSLHAKIKYLYFSPKSDQFESFFARLNNASKQSVRIWYYGDSQVEGDRITREVRTVFQKRFGGYGMGFVPLSNPASYIDLELGKQGDWKKYNCFQHRKKTSDFGPSGLVFIPANNAGQKWNYIQFKVLKSLKYKQLSLQCNADTLHQVEWKLNKDSAWKKVSRVKAQRKIHAYLIGDSALYGSLQIRCKGSQLKVYGLNFEGSPSGIYLDNFGIRGHSGDGLKAISNELLRNVSIDQQAGLVIFHYGNNMVPYLKLDPKSEKWAKDIFRSVFRKYRKNCPDLSFLVIGPGDMGFQKGENAESYVSCSHLNSWMKDVAMEEGMAYFDFYQMIRDAGGILSWRSKHIASLDGHLAPQGQRIFAKELTTEILSAFEAFKIRTGE